MRLKIVTRSTPVTPRLSWAARLGTGLSDWFVRALRHEGQNSDTDNASGIAVLLASPRTADRKLDTGLVFAALPKSTSSPATAGMRRASG